MRTFVGDTTSAPIMDSDSGPFSWSFRPAKSVPWAAMPRRVFFTTRNSVPVLRSSFLKAVIFPTFMPLYPARTASVTLLSLS